MMIHTSKVVAASDDVHDEPRGIFCVHTSRQHNPEVAEEVNLTSNASSHKSSKQVNINVDGKQCQKEEAARKTFDCHQPQCWVNKSKGRFLEVLLMVSSFLLSFATAGAFYFTRALSIVGSNDPVLKQILPALNWIFAASFFSNFLGVFVVLILQSRHEYHPYKKFSLITSNAASFLFLALGYGSLIAFSIQSR